MTDEARKREEAEAQADVKELLPRGWKTDVSEHPDVAGSERFVASASRPALPKTTKTKAVVGRGPNLASALRHLAQLLRRR